MDIFFPSLAIDKVFLLWFLLHSQFGGVLWGSRVRFCLSLFFTYTHSWWIFHDGFNLPADTTYRCSQRRVSMATLKPDKLAMKAKPHPVLLLFQGPHPGYFKDSSHFHLVLMAERLLYFCLIFEHFGRLSLAGFFSGAFPSFSSSRHLLSCKTYSFCGILQRLWGLDSFQNVPWHPLLSSSDSCDPLQSLRATVASRSAPRLSLKTTGLSSRREAAGGAMFSQLLALLHCPWQPAQGQHRS